MYKLLYKKQITQEKYQQGPFAKEREKYLKHRYKQGTTLSTMKDFVPVLFDISENIDVGGNRKISKGEILKITEEWIKQKYKNRNGKKRIYRLFYRTAIDWCHFLGKLEDEDKYCNENIFPYLHIIEGYKTFLEQEAGFSTETICYYLRCARPFLEWFSFKDKLFSEISATDVDTFLACKGSNWNRITFSNVANALKSFFRYAEKKRLCTFEISNAIITPTIFKNEKLPVGPTWDDVKLLISHLNTNKPANIRDRAIIMLLAVYGFRRSEVVQLQLKDIDWQEKTITALRSKGRRSQIYPLTTEVEAAIKRYINEARPKIKHCNLFLSIRAPIKPITPASISNLTRYHFINSNIKTSHYGPHSLRHACASNLVNKGLPLNEVGHHLGHKNLDSTRVYAKINIVELRKVAKFDFGGLI